MHIFSSCNASIKFDQKSNLRSSIVKNILLLHDNTRALATRITQENIFATIFYLVHSFSTAVVHECHEFSGCTNIIVMITTETYLCNNCKYVLSEAKSSFSNRMLTHRRATLAPSQSNVFH